MFKYESIVLPHMTGKYNISPEGQLSGCCPFHPDKHPSFSMNLENRFI